MNNSSLTWGTHISRQFTSIPRNGSPTVVRWVGFYVHVCVTRGATLEVAQFYGKRPREKWKRRDESLKNRVEKERGKKKEKKGSSFRFYISFYISWALLTFIFFTPLHWTSLALYAYASLSSRDILTLCFPLFWLLQTLNLVGGSGYF